MWKEHLYSSETARKKKRLFIYSHSKPFSHFLIFFHPPTPTPTTTNPLHIYIRMRPNKWFCIGEMSCHASHVIDIIHDRERMVMERNIPNLVDLTRLLSGDWFRYWNSSMMWQLTRQKRAISFLRVLVAGLH